MNFLGALYPLTEVQRPTDLTKIFSATVRWLGSATYLPQESWKGLHFEAQTPCLGQIGSQYPILQRMRGDTPISLILHEVPEESSGHVRDQAVAMPQAKLSRCAS